MAYPATTGGTPNYMTNARNMLLGGNPSTPVYGMANAGNTYTGGNYQPYGMANAGNNFYQRQTGGGGNSGAGNWGGTPSAGPTPGVPSNPNNTGGAANPGGAYVGQQYVPRVTQTTTLSPAQQGILDRQQTFQTGLLDAGNQLTGQIPTGAPDIPTQGQYNQSAADAVYNQQAAYLDPQFQVQQQQLADQLRTQGIPEGSPAWQQQMDQFNRDKTFAYGQARNSAVQEGYDVSNQQFEQGMQSGEARYQLPVSNLATLIGAYTGTGGVQSPQATATQSGIQPTNLSDAFNLHQNALNTAYQAGQNAYSANMNAGTDVATALLYAGMK